MKFNIVVLNLKVTLANFTVLFAHINKQHNS